MNGKPNNYRVERLRDGQWQFWFNGRGKSAAELKNRACWANKAVRREDVRVLESTASDGQAFNDEVSG